MERSLTTSEDFLLAARAVGRMVLGSAPQAAVRRAQEELEAAEAAAPGVSRTAYLREAFSLTRGETLLLEAGAELLFARGELPEHFHWDIRYAFRATDSEAYRVSDESHDLAWIEIGALRAVTQEESMLRMARKWRDGQGPTAET